MALNRHASEIRRAKELRRYRQNWCSSGFRSADVIAGRFNNARTGNEVGDWEIFLEPSARRGATLLIATGKPVDWEAATEEWAY